MKFGELRKPLLFTCLAASVAFHGGAVWYFAKHPFTMEQDLNNPMQSRAVALEVEQEKDKILEETLNGAIAQGSPREDSPVETEPTRRTEAPKEKILFATEPKIRKEETFNAVSTQPATPLPAAFDPQLSLSLADFALEESIDDPFSEYESEIAASVSVNDLTFVEMKTIAYLEDDYTVPEETKDLFDLSMAKNVQIATAPLAKLEPLDNNALFVEEEMTEESMLKCQRDQISHQLILPNSVDYLREQWTKRSVAEASLPDLDFYGLDQLAANFEWEEGLDVEISLMPDIDRKKYIFSLTLQPDFQTNLSAMKQHFVFVIDRSSSVEKSKFNRYKRAVQRSLAALCEGDTFNIYFLDKNVEKLAHRNLPVTPQTIEQAEEFLDRENAKTHFASTEIYESLESLVPENVKENELCSVILITDGQTMLGSQKQKKALSSLSEKLQGNINFYTASSGKGNNLVLLDLLSYVTGGKLVYSETNAGFPRKLVHLVKDLHQPLVKNLSIDITTADPNARIHLAPKNQLLSPLFAGQPYTVTGTISELCDLTLFIQGTSQDRVLNIHKNLSLKEAHSGGRTLEKKWANSQSKVCYEHFLKNGKHAHLTEAKQIVTPYKGEIAFD